MLAACLGGLWLMARHSIRTLEAGGTLLVMLTLVPLVNMPFDWASIGVTRGLLRRGSARGASPALPFLLGIADFLIGLALLVALACALVLALHTADAVVLAAGADKPLIDVPARLLTLGRTPYDPENWWVYLTLFSTLIPSAFNLAIGMISLATVSSERRRNSLIRRIEHLSADGKGEGGTRFEIVVSLATPVFLGTLATGLLIWAATLLLLHAGGKALWWFLGHIAWIEWLMMTR